jgi:hypothetical protein
MVEYEYKIYKHDYTDNITRIESELNEYGKQGWDVFNMIMKENKDYYELPSTIYYMKRIKNGGKHIEDEKITV